MEISVGQVVRHEVDVPLNMTFIRRPLRLPVEWIQTERSGELARHDSMTHRLESRER